MVSISIETAEKSRLRLEKVMSQASLKTYDGIWTFEDFPLSEFPNQVGADALALVRDDQVWSQLVPWSGSGEKFHIFRFQFPSDADNSGFVGWLASIFKNKLGTGVFVTCGSNNTNGGIFDYWGVPVELAAECKALLNELMKVRE
jgi:Family of unknown function (DUF6196)